MKEIIVLFILIFIAFGGTSCVNNPAIANENPEIDVKMIYRGSPVKTDSAVWYVKYNGYEFVVTGSGDIEQVLTTYQRRK